MKKPKMFREELAERKSKPTTVSEYIKLAPKEGQAHLRKMYACAKTAAPKATEAIKWGAPTFAYHRILIAFAGHKKHMGFMPTPPVITAFKKDLVKYKTSKGTIQFPYDQPLPITLIKKMIKLRIKQSLEKDVRWM